MRYYIGRLKCFLGFHKWKNLNKTTPNPKKGEKICWSDPHKCDRCGKKKWLGMGCIYG